MANPILMLQHLACHNAICIVMKRRHKKDWEMKHFAEMQLSVKEWDDVNSLLPRKLRKEEGL